MDSKPEVSQISRSTDDVALSESEGGIDTPELSDAEVKKLLRKQDLHLMPVLSLLYLMSFLDRGSIGNANILGLSKDLKLHGRQYNWALTAFFFPYCFLEPVSNLLLIKFKPSRWLPSIMVAWGIVMTLTGIVKNYEGLVAARFFLGATEAGLFPGVAYYISLFYPRRDAQFRIALIFASASLAGAFSGLLAYAIGYMDGVGGLHGWRWIFILEGILTVLISIVAFFTIYDHPTSASFLTEAEKKIVMQRVYGDYNRSVKAEAEAEEKDSIKWVHVKMALTDWQTWFHVLGYWGIACPLYGISLFLPAIINGLGYTAKIAQLMTLPIYGAACISCLVVAYWSDRLKKRGYFIFGCQLAMVVGYIMAVAPAKFSPGVTYAGCLIAACGLYPAIPGLVAWSSNNYAPNAKRAVAMAIQIGAGTMGGAAASNFYKAADKPRYRTGHILELVFCATGFLSMFTYWLIIRRINKKRAEIPVSQLSPEESRRLGDKAPDFMYVL